MIKLTLTPRGGREATLYLLSLGVNRCFKRQLSKEWSYHKSLWGPMKRREKELIWIPCFKMALNFRAISLLKNNNYCPKKPQESLPNQEFKVWSTREVSCGGQLESLFGCIELPCLQIDITCVAWEVEDKGVIPFQRKKKVDHNNPSNSQVCHLTNDRLIRTWKEKTLLPRSVLHSSSWHSSQQVYYIQGLLFSIVQFPKFCEFFQNFSKYFPTYTIPTPQKKIPKKHVFSQCENLPKNKNKMLIALHFYF